MSSLREILKLTFSRHIRGDSAVTSLLDHGKAIDQVVAYILMILALVLTYLLH